MITLIICIEKANMQISVLLILYIFSHRKYPIFIFRFADTRCIEKIRNWSTSFSVHKFLFYHYPSLQILYTNVYVYIHLYNLRQKITIPAPFLRVNKVHKVSPFAGAAIFLSHCRVYFFFARKMNIKNGRIAIRTRWTRRSTIFV